MPNASNSIDISIAKAPENTTEQNKRIKTEYKNFRKQKYSKINIICIKKTLYDDDDQDG